MTTRLIESDHSHRRIPGGEIRRVKEGEWFAPEPGECIGGGGPFWPDRRFSYCIHGSVTATRARLVRFGSPSSASCWEVEEA